MGTLIPEEYVAWAVDRLLCGDDTPSLRILASLDLDGLIDSHEVETYFEKTLAELGVALPEKIEHRQEWERPPRVGFWYSDEMPELPHPRDYVDPGWDEAERALVIEYLDSAYIRGGALGYSWCRMGCPGGLGHRDLTDGTWIFPEGLVHYLKEHAVKPVEAFLEHVRRNDYRVPDLFLRRIHPPRWVRRVKRFLSWKSSRLVVI